MVKGHAPAFTFDPIGAHFSMTCTIVDSTIKPKFISLQNVLQPDLSQCFVRRIGASVIRFRTKSLPHYYTTEYPEIDLTAITTMTVYANPAVADATGCLKRGPVGLAYNGVPFLNVYYTTGLYIRVGIMGHFGHV